MSVFTRMARGCHLGIRSLIVVLRDKTLLVFPLITTFITVTTVSFFYVSVGPDKFQAFFNTIRNDRGVQHINWGYYLDALIAYGVLAIITVFFSVGLVVCTRITLDERDSKFTDGFMTATRKLHWIILWAFISWTIGPVLNLLDHQRHTSRWVRKILKTTWSLLSYFVIPILIIDNVNVFSAIRRSVTQMTSKWGKGAVSQLGLVWFFLLLNIPTMLIFGFGTYPEGPWPSILTLVILLYGYGTIVVYQTASSVLSVVLYKYASDGIVVKGFKEEYLRDAFVRPKIYVLVADEPGKDYGQVVEATTEEEPVAEPQASDTVAMTEDAIVHDAPEASLAEDSAVTPADNEDSEPKPS